MRKIPCRVNQQVQHYEIFLKKTSAGVLKLSFSLGLALIFIFIFFIFPSVMVLMSVPFGMYCLTSLFSFSTAPFCHEQYESAKYTGTSRFLVIHSCSANSLPLSVVIVFSAFPLYGSSNLHTTFANGFAFFPYLSFSMSRKLVLRSTSVSMALLSLSTIRSISQSPKRFPSASAGRSCMLTRFFMFVALVSCLREGERLYFILWRHWAASSPVPSFRMMT